MEIRRVVEAFLDSKGAEFERSGAAFTFLCPLDCYRGSCSGWVNTYGDDELAVGFSILHVPAVAREFIKALPGYDESLFLYPGLSEDQFTVAWESRKQYVWPHTRAIRGCLANVFTKAEKDIAELLKLFDVDARLKYPMAPVDLAKLLTGFVGVA